MLAKQMAEPSGFLAEIHANDLVATKRRVAFVEKKIKATMHGVESPGKLE